MSLDIAKVEAASRVVDDMSSVTVTVVGRRTAG